jgi:hypothetical protein
VLKGLLAGGIALGVAAVFPEPLLFPFLAVVLGLMAGVYPGMAMADPQRGTSAGPWILALAFLGLGLTGLVSSPLFLAGAFLGHGALGFLNKFTAVGDDVPEAFPGFSITFDTVLAGFVTYVWLTRA